MTSLLPGDDHPGLVGEDDGLHPVAQAELGQQVADVELDGRARAVSWTLSWRRRGLGVNDDEQGVPVYVATGLKSSWAQAWPAFRDYS
jgi:hypothetical protein